MQLKYCAFTGADDAVDPKELLALSKEFPFVEWSILYLPGELGNPRCPTVEWISKFKDVCADAHKCLHLCGAGLPGFMAKDKEVTALIQGFSRAQFNFEYLNGGSLIDPAVLARRATETPGIEFILQYGKTYAHYLPFFKHVPNHAVLFDGSAGEGINPGEWPAPIGGHACGYAGGINPDNVTYNLEKISRAAPGYTTWIDMESGIRTDNKWDFVKVRRVLEIASDYVK